MLLPLVALRLGLDGQLLALLLRTGLQLIQSHLILHGKAPEGNRALMLYIGSIF